MEHHYKKIGNFSVNKNDVVNNILNDETAELVFFMTTNKSFNNGYMFNAHNITLAEFLAFNFCSAPNGQFPFIDGFSLTSSNSENLFDYAFNLNPNTKVSVYNINIGKSKKFSSSFLEKYGTYFDEKVKNKYMEPAAPLLFVLKVKRKLFK